MSAGGGLGSSPDDPFADVLTAARAGEEWAFNALFREWNPPLIRFLRARAADAAEDLASEVWLTAARTLGQFQGGRPEWRAWLFTLAHRRSIDHLRRSSRRRTDPAPAAAFAREQACDDPAEEATERLSAQAAVNALAATLNAEQAEVILLRVVAGLDSAEVATIMGRSPGWVRVTQHRALRRLSDHASLDRSAIR